jgi:hypothetical protein
MRRGARSGLPGGATRLARVIIYPDTSFMVSWLYAKDANHPKASAWFARQINPDIFLTFDRDQSVLAINRGFNTVLIR